MLDRTAIMARNLVIEQIEKLIEKNSKKAEKEKEKKNCASVTYKGETYSSDAELQDAYACDVFSSATYDRLLNKLEAARGGIDENAFTPTEMLVIELKAIKENFQMELMQDRIAKDRKAEREKRMQELASEGYTFREAEAIISNEELMRFE